MSTEEESETSVQKTSDVTSEKLETENNATSIDENKLDTTSDVGETKGATSSTEKVSDVAERDDQNKPEQEEPLIKNKNTMNLDDIENEITDKTDVIIMKRENPIDDVIEEVRSQYLWEGPCSSSSSSDDEKEKEKVEDFEEEDDRSSAEELKIKVFPRDEYIKKYGSLILEKVLLRKKNVILQKHVYEYCKKRKLEVYYEETTTPDPKLEAKYTRQLTTFQEFLQLDKERRISLQEDLEKLQEERVEAEVTFDRVLEELIETERVVGTGLISATNGKTIPDKVLEKILNKQRKTILELHDIRMKFIQLRDSVANKETALKKLETFGEGLHLLDYEQLKFENQSYSDKIDERDEELTHLRMNATSSIQILAHIREKANSTALNIEELYEDLEFMEMEVNSAREETGNLKKQTDELREQLEKLRRDAGLLVHQHLIRDFERRIEESQALAVEIENLKNNYYDQNKRLTEVQETITLHKSFKDSLNSQINKSLNRIFSHKHSKKSLISPGSHKTQNSSSEEEKETSVAEIRKGRPFFFPREKYSKSFYLKQSDRME